MSEEEEINWDSILPRDNSHIEELSHEDIKLVEQYAIHQQEIKDSGLPVYLAEMYSLNLIKHPFAKKCYSCNQDFIPDEEDMAHCTDYCSLLCSQRDQI